VKTNNNSKQQCRKQKFEFWRGYNAIIRPGTAISSMPRRQRPQELKRRAISALFGVVHDKFSSPFSTLYAWNAWDYDPPFGHVNLINRVIFFRDSINNLPWTLDPRYVALNKNQRSVHDLIKASNTRIGVYR